MSVLSAISFLSRALGALSPGRPAGTVAVGDVAPEFTLTSSEGQPVSLAGLRAEGPVLLAFFPRAFTAGCTRELRTYTDQHAQVLERGARVVAISTDDPATLARFKASLGAPFTFLSDPEGAVSRQYAGVSLGTANRATVTVTREGRVARITAGLPAIFPAEDIAGCG
jgi:peroxiredoxin Q/BCP